MLFPYTPHMALACQVIFNIICCCFCRLLKCKYVSVSTSSFPLSNVTMTPLKKTRYHLTMYGSWDVPSEPVSAAVTICTAEHLIDTGV